MSGYDLLEIIARHAVISITDTLASGMGSAISNSVKDIKEYAQKTNEALYYLQIKTFLETVDLDQAEVNNFFEQNPDNLRLGIEVFKILEHTYIETQAKYLAIAFKKYVLKKINKEKLNEYIFIISQLDQYIVNSIGHEIWYNTNVNKLSKPTENVSLKLIQNNIVFLDMPIKRSTAQIFALKSIGFLQEVYDFSNLKSPIKEQKIIPKYERTTLFQEFFKDIIKETDFLALVKEYSHEKK